MSDVDKIKYLNYIIRTLKRNMNEENIMRKIRMIVIYTADIEPEQTRPKMDIGCLQFQLEEAFLMKLDSKQIEGNIQRKLGRGEMLTAEEQMQFIILPLTYRGKSCKQACIQRCFEMAKRIKDEQEQVFLLSGMLVFSDKVIDTNDAARIREWIMMTKVAKLFEDEKIEYGKQESAKAARENEIKIVKRLFAKGESVDYIAGIVDILTREEIAELKDDNE